MSFYWLRPTVPISIQDQPKTRVHENGSLSLLRHGSSSYLIVPSLQQLPFHFRLVSWLVAFFDSFLQLLRLYSLRGLLFELFLKQAVLDWGSENIATCAIAKIADLVPFSPMINGRNARARLFVVRHRSWSPWSSQIRRRATIHGEDDNISGKIHGHRRRLRLRNNFYATWPNVDWSTIAGATCSSIRSSAGSLERCR